MKTQWHDPIALFGVAALSLLMGTTALAAPARGSVKQMGASSLVYRGPRLQVALGYRYAKTAIGSRWLFLDAEMTATRSTVEIPRKDIAVETPGGEVVPMATQRAFANAYGAMRANIAAANVASQPINYLVPQRPRRLRYFARPGYRLAFSRQWLNPEWNYFGRLYFEVPGGVQHGGYALLIRLPKETVRIPFTL
jgi:hypothetical protein